MSTIPQDPTENLDLAALTIDAFADDTAALTERLADVLAERDAYRELAQVALERVAQLTTKLECLKVTSYRLRDELRAERTR